MIRLVVVDDHEMVRRGLSLLFEATDDIQLIGAARDGVEALNLCHMTQPQVVVMDVEMPRMDGITTTAILHEAYPQTVVILLCAYYAPDLEAAASKAGAHGLLVKDVTGTTIVEAVRHAHHHTLHTMREKGLL